MLMFFSIPLRAGHTGLITFNDIVKHILAIGGEKLNDKVIEILADGAASMKRVELFLV